ncbi:hypothetical protein V8F33_011203 [Rhypophila sp. PSN 637]
MLKQTSPVSSPNKPEFKPTTPTTTAPEASTADIAPTTDTSNNDNDKNTDTSSDDDPVVYQQWGPTIHHFVKQIHLAWSSSPRPLTSATKPQIDEFMTCWRSAFDKLAREIEADTSFPQELTTPPVSRFDILLFTQDSGLDCPCCLPIVKSSITLKADDGVGLTKGDFVRAVGGYLYGFETFSESSSSQSKADGEIATDNSQHGADVAPEPSQQDEVDSNASSSAFYEEPAPTEYKFPAVIWDSSWLSAGGRGPNGERIVYGSTPKVWLFCCTPGDFEDRVGTERFIKKRKNWDEAYNKKATDDSEKKEVKNNE